MAKVKVVSKENSVAGGAEVTLEGGNMVRIPKLEQHEVILLHVK